MKKFKWIDLGISILLYAALGIGMLTGRVDFLAAYTILGAWQLFSIITHTTCGWFMQIESLRNLFHAVVLGIFLCLLLAYQVPFFSFIFLLLLFGFPVLSFIYIMLCYDECRAMNKRPLSLIK